MNWPFVSRAVHREFLASAEARARAEHDNAQNLRHELAAAESRTDQERAERIAAHEAHERARAVWASGVDVLEKALAEARGSLAAADANEVRRVNDLEAARQEAAKERANRLVEQDAADKRYTALLDRLLTVATPSIPSVHGMIPFIEHEPQSEGDKEISKVIREQAGDNHALAKDLRRTARELKAQGKTPDEIVGVLVSVWTSEQVS